MDSNEQLFKRMLVASKNLKSIKRPVPKKFDGQKIFDEIEQLETFLENPYALAIADGQSDDLEGLTMLLAMNQRLIFNRRLAQLTPLSLTDGLLISMKNVLDDETRVIMGQLIAVLCTYLEDNHLTTESDLSERFLSLLEQRDPELYLQVGAAVISTPASLGSIDDEYDNHPVQLLDESVTTFYAQNTSLGIDFNDFIRQVAARNSPAQLQLAYQLFANDHSGYQRILAQAVTVEGMKPTAQEERNIRFAFSLVWMFSKALTVGAVIDLAKVFHLFMKFCLDSGLMTAREYAVIQRLGNQALIGVTLSRGEDDTGSFMAQQEAFNKNAQLADEVFTNPNYTISVPKARRFLTAHQVKPTQAFSLTHDHPLKLKKVLDQHQLDLEMKKAHQLVSEFSAVVPAIFADDWAVYERVILQLHHDMVVNYNRRFQHWTRESLTDALNVQFTTDRSLNLRPAFFRVFEDYLYEAEDDGAIKNADALVAGLLISQSTYLAVSTNAMTKR